MLSTLINVAGGSLLKLGGAIINGYFENKRLTTLAISERAERIAALQSGADTADDYTKHTRRVIAWMWAFTCCMVITFAALEADWGARVSEANERSGLWGWILGTRSTTTRDLAAEIIFMTWNLLEIMFGFFFTKIGGRK